MNMSIKDKAALGRANTKKEQNKIMKIVQGPDGMMYKVSPDGDMELISDKNKTTKKSLDDLINPLSGASLEGVARALGKTITRKKNVDGPDLTKRAKGGMVKKYMGGGSVHKNKNKMLTTKGWGASRKT